MTKLTKLGLDLARMSCPIVHRLADELEQLRDAAQAVVDHAEDNSCMECYHEYKVLVSGKTLQTLSALLPKEQS